MANTITLHFRSICAVREFLHFSMTRLLKLKYMGPMGIASIGRLQRGREGISL